MMFISILHKTDHLGNATMKHLLAVQPTGRNNAAEFSAEEKTTKQNPASLSVFPRLLHIESFTLLMCSGA